MNFIDYVSSLNKQRLVEDSILLVEAIKVLIELGFHLCKLCLEIFDSFDSLLNC